MPDTVKMPLVSILYVSAEVNNKPQPGCEEFLKQSWGDEVELIPLSPSINAYRVYIDGNFNAINQGYADGAIKQAIETARGKYICLLYNDSFVSKESIVKLLEGLEFSPEINLAYFPLAACEKESELAVISSNAKNLDLQVTEFVDLLYDESPRLCMLWRKSVHNDLGYLDESLSLFLCREFCLRVAMSGSVLFSPESAGKYLVRDEYYQPKYKQVVYDEEMQVKEKYVRAFLSPKYNFTASLKDRILRHSKIIALYFKQLEVDSENIDVAEFDKQMFFYSLLLAKHGDLAEAKHMLFAYFNIVNASRNCTHLYRIILSPYLSGPPVIKPATRKEPLVSIPMALYNHGQYLDTALQSIFAQTITDWEVVIINDGSTDNSLRIAKDLLAKYNDPRLRIVSKANEGLPKTRSRGMQETTAPYICQLDPDDMIAPEYLEKALAILENEPDVGWVIPKTLVFGGNNHITWFWEYDFLHSLIKSPCPALSVFKREAWEDVGGYFQDDMSCREDWEFWMRLGEHGWQARTMDDVYFIYRHAFGRWGEKNEFNLTSKMDIIKHHPWWYKKLDEKQLRELFLVSKVAEFPQEILEPGMIKRVMCEAKNKIAHRKMFESIKKEYHEQQRFC